MAIDRKKKCCITWVVDDVKEQAKVRGLNLSDKVCEQILWLMERKHDAGIGINWDVIDAWIDYYEMHKEDF